MFYKEEIIPAKVCESIDLELEWLRPPIAFVHVPGVERGRSEGSKFNVLEARVCVDLVEKLIAYGVFEKEIAVISPYRAQVDLIKKYFEDRGLIVDVGTVDSFQGCERDVVVFSVTATKNFYFASNPNRLNVAFLKGKSILSKFVRNCIIKKRFFDWKSFVKMI
ncbi:C-terminal helicase domain-containing protein [Archaeoglobus sp.]